VVLLLIAAVGVFLAAWGPRTWQQYQLLSLQRKCLDYTAPASQIVFDDRKDSLPQLRRSDPEVLPGMAKSAHVGRVPLVWQQYYARISPPGLQSHGTAFLHRLRSPSGNQRLVGVEAHCSYHSGYSEAT